MLHETATRTDRIARSDRSRKLRKRRCHGNPDGGGGGVIGDRALAAAVACCHRTWPSALKVLSVRREIRWRWMLNLLWIAAWVERKRWA